MDAVERLEALLTVMDETQGKDSEYSRDVRLGIERIKELEGKMDEKVFENLIEGYEGRIEELKEVVRDYWGLEAKVKELEEKVLRIIRGEFKQICCYCGWESKEGQWEELQAHLRECKQHPLCQALEHIKELEEREREAYLKGYDEGIKDGLAH